MILPHFRDDLNAMSKLSRVSSLFHEVAAQFIWKRATIKDLVDCVSDTENLSRYASFINTLNISWSHELWPEGVVPRPTFASLKQLSVTSNALCGNSLDAVTPMFTSSLRQLRLWIRARHDQQDLHDHFERDLLFHVSATCSSLTKLSLELFLPLSSVDLATFIAAMGQLKVLRLGWEMNLVLNHAVLVEVFSLPNLEDLSLNLQLDHDFMTVLRNAKEPHQILPRIKKLELSFSEGGGLAPALLFAVILTVEQLWVTLAEVTPGQIVSLHPATFEMLGLLSKLEALQVQFEPGMQITYNELAALSNLPNLKSLRISRIYRHGDPSTDDIVVSGHELAASLLGFNSLESLWLSVMPAHINATYDEAQTISHRLAQIYPGYQSSITLVVDEAVSFGWPSFEDLEPLRAESVASDIIWQASSKNFSPDIVDWAPRNLNVYTDANGTAIPLNKVVTDGVYNHLIDHGT